METEKSPTRIQSKSVRRYLFSPAVPKARMAMSRDPRTLAQAIHSAIRLGRYLPITARIRPLKKGKKSKRNRIVFIKESSPHPVPLLSRERVG